MAVRDIRSLDIAMLRTFDALLRERSVSRAAERLFLSQPAVSASLKRLREVFDDKLFSRTAHGVSPTAKALTLAPRVLAVLAEVSRLLNADHPFDPAGSDRILRVAGSDHSGRTMLPALCETLSAADSRMRIFWEAANYASMVERISKGDVDVGLLPRVTAPPGDIESALLYEDAYVVVSRHGRPLPEGGMHIDEFCAARQVFLGYGRSALDDMIDQVLARSGRRRHNQVAVTSFAQMVDLLVRSDQLAVFPSRVARSHADALAAHPLPFDLPGYGLYVCWDRRSDDDPAVQWLVGELLRLGRA